MSISTGLLFYPEYQSKGIAKSLIGYVEEATILAGYDRVTLGMRIY
ncbi:GNAT family N-acetyltransferase [candidate division KSB1 bacterium]|nr:GNAT family N-acetyltransferase [candidate division KSB1 bacterium]